MIDPLGVTIAAAAEGPVLLMAEIISERIALARQQLPFFATDVLRHRNYCDVFFNNA